MATTRAIAATSKGILRVLEQAYVPGDFGGLAAEFALYQASDFQKPMKFGLSLYLYRVTVNVAARNGRPHTGADGKRMLPPLPVDLHYLLTAWGATASDQQEVLGWGMRTLQDVAVLPAAVMNANAPGVFGPAETVELSADSLSHQDLVPFWELMKPNQRLSAPYMARMVALESTVAVSEHPDVQTRVFEMHTPAVPS